MSANNAEYEFEQAKILPVFELINDLFRKVLSKELGEADEVVLLRDLTYELVIAALDIHVSFRYKPEGKKVTALAKSKNPDSFISIKTLLSFVTILAREKVSHGILEFLEPLFQSTPRPDYSELMGCSLEHLAACPECQEAQDNFSQRRWQDASGDWDVPIQYADICFLASPAKLYFFPAYLLTAVKYENSTIIESAEFFSGSKRNYPEPYPRGRSRVGPVLHLRKGLLPGTHLIC